LSISKSLVLGMNGEIGYFGTEGGGTTFFFELPLAAASQASSSAVPAEARP